jgi:hypothetical protein
MQKGATKSQSYLYLLTPEQENGHFSTDPKAKTENLHRLAQQLHIRVENFTDLEELMQFLLDASEKIRHAISPTLIPGTTSEAEILSYFLSKAHSSKRWVSNYRDRANIRINLVRNALSFHARM